MYDGIFDKIGSIGVKEMEGWKGKRREEGEGEENLWEQDSRDGERTEIRASKEIFLIEGAIKGQTRNLAQETFPGIHKDDQVKTIINKGEGA